MKEPSDLRTCWQKFPIFITQNIRTCLAKQNLLGSKARFRCRTSHESNWMLISENKGFFSFAFNSAHVKNGVWNQGSRFIYFTLFTYRKKSIVIQNYKIKNNYSKCYKNVHGGQSSEGFLVDHHLLLNKQRNDTELNQDVVENTCRA